MTGKTESFGFQRRLPRGFLEVMLSPKAGWQHPISTRRGTREKGTQLKQTPALSPIGQGGVKVTEVEKESGHGRIKAGHHGLGHTYPHQANPGKHTVLL